MMSYLSRSMYDVAIAILMIVGITSCSVSKGLQDGQIIYKETIIKIDVDDTKAGKNLNESLNAIPKVGSSFGLLNTKLGIHNIYPTTKEKGFKHWVKHSLGTAPILYQTSQLKQTEAKLTFYLNGKGYLDNNVKCSPEIEKNIATIHCLVEQGTRYTIDSIIYPSDTILASMPIYKIIKKNIWKKGELYDRDKLQFVRTSLTNLANNSGYADFREENIFYYVDTVTSSNTINLYIEIIQPSDSTYHRRYMMKDISIYPNYSLHSSDKDSLSTIDLNNHMYVMESQYYLSHDLIKRLILQQPDQWYNTNLVSKTITRLLDLGLFRFVNINNEAILRKDTSYIKQKILLTPEPIQSVSGEFELNNRSGNFFGTGASVSYTHKNIFGGAEKLKLSLSGQVESQVGDGLSFINTTDLNIAAQISFPKIFIPGITIKESRQYIPRTILNTNFTYKRQIQFYTLESLVVKYGFLWRSARESSHELYPIVINQVLVRDKSTAFQELIDKDIRLRRSFDDVLIAGMEYVYTYTNQTNSNDRNYSYLRGEIESNGNLVNVFASTNEAVSNDIFGINYAQFSALSMDYRQYWKAGRSDLVARMYIGLGFAYGNSSELPYSKQFMIGGSNSLRAFPLRGLGPGSFTPNGTQDPFALQFIDRTGDIKLEWNLEYRFPIISYLKGALFVDAGNVWLRNDQSRPDGNFSRSQFYREIAIGSGLGLRLDFDFFLIRLDIAFPLRSPEPGDGFEWQTAEINPLSSAWRKENLQYNIGIGYPF